MKVHEVLGTLVLLALAAAVWCLAVSEYVSIDTF